MSISLGKKKKIGFVGFMCQLILTVLCWKLSMCIYEEIQSTISNGNWNLRQPITYTFIIFEHTIQFYWYSYTNQRNYKNNMYVDL